MNKKEFDVRSNGVMISVAGMGCVDASLFNAVHSYELPAYEDLDYDANKLLAEKVGSIRMTSTPSDKLMPAQLLDKMVPRIPEKSKQSGSWYEERKFISITYCKLNNPNVSESELRREYEELRKELSVRAWSEVDLVLPYVPGMQSVKRKRSDIYKGKLREQYLLLLESVKR